jgi:hypothetical protein
MSLRPDAAAAVPVAALRSGPFPSPAGLGAPPSILGELVPAVH